MTMIETPWRPFHRGGERYRIRANYGIDYPFGRRNNQSPHFSVTGETMRQAGNGRWMEDSGGCIHDEVSKHFPNLRKYIKWHLTALDGPLHYIANAKYWWEKMRGLSRWADQPGDPNPVDAFKHTIIFGVLPDDAENYARTVQDDWSQVEEWLRSRHEMLMAEFAKDMSELNVLE